MNFDHPDRPTLSPTHDDPEEEPPTEDLAPSPPDSLEPALRASLMAKLERLLSRPIIAQVVGVPQAPEEQEEEDDAPMAFQALVAAAQPLQSKRDTVWVEDPEDGTCTVRIALDYDDAWRGCEKEILETTASTVESAITFLTEPQRKLLQHAPREFLALLPRPESAELVAFDTENVGGSVRVVSLRLAAAPASRAHIRHVAIVPNLVQFERQLNALTLVQSSRDDGPMGPLRALLGACPAARLHVEAPSPEPDVTYPGERFDEHQRTCVQHAMRTPHFAVIEGPPGSGKTTVITGIIRRALARGERVLVVSPTHVAVDNVVEKLVPRGDPGCDPLDAQSLPLRYAARKQKLSECALAYWVGAKKQHRAATISRRLQARLIDRVPIAARLYALEDTRQAGHAPLSAALVGVQSVFCGTPIGILSYEAVKQAPSGSFGLLIVDEVSKMTLAEFLAIAVKAKRWVLVGDPAQLPPYNNAEENGTTLNGVVSPVVELACSVGALLERAKPATRPGERLVVVASNPVRAVAVMAAHLAAVLPEGTPPVGLVGPGGASGIVVCDRDGVERACEALANNPMLHGGSPRDIRILVERGVGVPRPAFASGRRLVEPRERAHATIFDNAFNVFHAQPWAIRSGQRLRFLGLRNGLDMYLPSAAALAAAGDDAKGAGRPAEARGATIEAIARRFAVNTISVYDWLTGLPMSSFDVSPLRELDLFARPSLWEAIQPFVGTLKKQYRMHPSLSCVPRRLFYFDRALFDGGAAMPGHRVKLLQVEAKRDEGEFNTREVEAIADLIARARGNAAEKDRPRDILVITPYRDQEARLRQALGALPEVDVCTLDRCQGREADYVFISLVRSKATPFMDMPKRWNVALTRAKQGLFLVGDIDAYLREAADAHRQLKATGLRGRPGETRPSMSLLARILEAYEQQRLGNLA